jgi:hypothetical protein
LALVKEKRVKDGVHLLRVKWNGGKEEWIPVSVEEYARASVNEEIEALPA